MLLEMVPWVHAGNYSHSFITTSMKRMLEVADIISYMCKQLLFTLGVSGIGFHVLDALATAKQTWCQITERN